MNYILLITLLFSTACSFKKKHEAKNPPSVVKDSRSTEANAELKALDSDGDMISDYDELQNGLDRYVANLPKLEVNFLQDYIIQIDYEDETSFLMDTKIARDNPDFKYRVGNLFLKENSASNAARLGRFSGVSWGKIQQRDFSWVKYPEIDKYYYFNKSHEYRKSQRAGIRQSSIHLENSLRLADSPLFRSIEQVELNFYYYNFEKESYVLLHTEKLDRVFQSGSREEFEIVIDNPPLDLIEDTYFRHGKFIISEVKDFYIPELKITYSQLLSSVKAKSIAIYKTTPFENDLSYVAIDSEGENFTSLLSKLFPEKFTIEENALTQVEQFSSNLSNYTYLHEVAKEDKLGRWFVMTNKIKDHYLKHRFTKLDTITLSYLTGSELADQEQEKIYSFSVNVNSTDKGKVYPLGNITNNSELEVSIYLNELEGTKLDVEYGRFSFRPPRCRNCTGTNWSVAAEFQVNKFSNFKQQWNVADIEAAKQSFTILINNKSLALDELIATNHATIELIDEKPNSYLHIKIKDFNELDVIDSGKENIAFIKLLPLSTGSIGEGVQINQMGGHNINKVFHAGLVNLKEAAKRKVPLAVTSWKFDEWQKNVPWGKRHPQTGYTPTVGSKKTYWTGVVVDLVSTITNNYN